MTDRNDQQLVLFENDQKFDRFTTKSILKSVFGHQDFRGPQERIIAQLMAGEDVLALMPTGGGKSLCYQLPALAREGMGVVVSPLISLMQDQVQTLNELGVAARFLNSSLSLKEQRKVEQEIVDGNIKILYLSPERIVKSTTLSMLRKCEISVIAIDEAHCVSRWGHDFRPEYLQLSKLNKTFPDTPRIALTASADKRTQVDILKHLNLVKAKVFRASFDRPNITYHIEKKKTDQQSELLSFLQSHQEETGIIYCLSRRKVEEIAEFLNQQGIEAYPYHAGLNRKTRHDHQQKFTDNENVIIVATIAFGMGIDRPDVRFVVHMDMPRNIESYYQETGRAGRDGQESVAYMMYSVSDFVVMKSMISQSVKSTHRLNVEYGGLEEMLALCEINHCRRQSLLLNFDEIYPRACGKCDNCLNRIDQSTLFNLAKETLITLKILHLKKESYDFQDYIDFFKGLITLKVRESKDFELEGFGLYMNATEKGIKFFLRQLGILGFIKFKYEEKVTLSLGPKALEFLNEPFPVLLKFSLFEYGKTSKTKIKAKASAPNQRRIELKPLSRKGKQELFLRLKELRRKLSKEKRIPAYKIFNDKTLEQLSQKRPTELKMMLEIDGVGDYKLKKWGKIFLNEIQSHS